MRIKVYAYILTSVVFLICGNSYAVEFQSSSGDSSEDVNEQVTNDRSEDVVSEMQNAKTPRAPSKPTDAAKQAKDWLFNAGMKPGMNKNGVFAVVATAQFDVDNPAYSDRFVDERSLASMEAVLRAKAKIIEFVNVKMTARNSLKVPGSNINKQFAKQVKNVEMKLKYQQQELASLLRDVNKKEADALRGVTFGDRADSLMDAAIKKLDNKYSSEKIAEDKKIKFKNAKANFIAARAKRDALMKRVDTMKASKGKSSSQMADTLADMVLLGAVGLTQFESYDPNKQRYKVSIVVGWSTKLEQAVQAYLTGASGQVKPGKTSLREWVSSQNWATSTGTRMFRDNEGNIHFIGIAAESIGDDADSEEAAVDSAEMFAKQRAVLAIYSDVESHKNAKKKKQCQKQGRSKSECQVGKSMALELSEGFSDREVNGVQLVGGNTYTHPISGREIYVAIASVNPKDALQAKKMFKSLTDLAVIDAESQHRLKGTKAGLKQAIKDGKADDSSFHTNKANARAGSRNAADGKFSNGSSAGSSSGSGRGSSSGQKGRSQGGTFQGAGSVDSFDW